MMKKKWWHDKIAYQIYPKSFCDSNGDGIGDIAGILSKLDYLQALGIDILWLSPIYQSPFVDQGYDISDYYQIAQVFGTMEEFDRLLAEVKRRGMYLVMDLVVNHCSNQHPWFQQALANPHGEYGDYFYFRRGKDGQPPSNYRSYFGGSTWEPVPGEEDLYYLHLFAREQPDLNWENPALRKEIYDMVNWWLQKGLAGFRIDAIINIKKDLAFPSYAPDGEDGLVFCTKMVEETRGVGEFLQELKQQTFALYDAFTVGEVFNMKEDELAEFVGENGHFSTMFDFSAQELTFGGHGWYDANPIVFSQWRDCIFAAQEKVQDIGFLANIIENHDEPRGASRFLPPFAQTEAGKKMLATTTLLLRGIPFLYQGQEIGMTNCLRESIDDYDDLNTIDQYQVALDAGCTRQEALACCYANSRDNARTPMQWSAAPGAGFTTGTPWLALNPNYREINVAEQEHREDSVLSYYKKLISLRKSPEYKDLFTYGTFAPAYTQLATVFAYTRTLQDKGQVLVATNYGKEPVQISLSLYKEEPVQIPLSLPGEGNASPFKNGEGAPAAEASRQATAWAKAPQVLLSNLGKEAKIAARLQQGEVLTLESCEAVVIAW